MNTATKDVLKMLEAFCSENKCAFVRSANSSNDIVLCVQTGSGSFEEVYFQEEIGTDAIKNGWYTI